MVKAMGIHAIITDRCWTLPPLSALAALLAVLLSKNSAVFYVAFMNEFGVSHESASWPIAVCTVSVQFSGLLVSYLEKRLSIYHITIAGSLLNFVALIAASFAPNITWMSITFGVLSGAGQGIIVVTLSIYAMLYFDKYRAAASGFKYTGISLAPFFSMLLSLSIQQDGLHGTLLLFSALSLNTLPIAMLMNNPRPVKLHCCKFAGRDHKPIVQKHNTIADALQGCSNVPTSRETDRTTSQRLPACCAPAAITNSSRNSCFSIAERQLRVDLHEARMTDKCLINRQEDIHNNAAIVNSTPIEDTLDNPNEFNLPRVGRNISGKDTIACPSRRQYELTAVFPTQQVVLGRYVHSSIFVLPPLQPYLSKEQCSSKYAPLAIAFQPPKYAQEAKGSSYSENCDANIPMDSQQRDVPETTIADRQTLAEVLRLFKNPILYLLVATFGLTDYVSSTFETTVLDYAVDKGATKSQALPIISYVAAAEIVGRLTLPFLWDSMRLSRSLLVALCLLGASVGLLAMPHATSFSHVIATAVTTGITTGCVTAMKPVLLSDSLGVDNLSFCWGIAGVLALPLHLGGPMLIGAFRDSMGSYDNLYRMLSALCIVFSLLLFGHTYFRRRRKKYNTSGTI